VLHSTVSSKTSRPPSPTFSKWPYRWLLKNRTFLAAARRLGRLTNDFPAPLYETLHDLTRRAQRAGLINADIVAEDFPRITAMLRSVLPTMDTTGERWHRYVTFILNAMTTAKPSEIPPASPISYTPQPRYVAELNRPNDIGQPRHVC
jgi:hypothetical protein